MAKKDLEKQCPRCNGKGIYLSKITPDAVNICEKCHGDGTIPYAETQSEHYKTIPVDRASAEKFSSDIAKRLLENDEPSDDPNICSQGYKIENGHGLGCSILPRCAECPNSKTIEIPLIELPEEYAGTVRIHMMNGANRQRVTDMAWFQKHCKTCADIGKVLEPPESHDMEVRRAFYDECIKYSHDHNNASDLDVVFDFLVAIKETGKLLQGGEQYPNSESCYDAIEALKAFIDHIMEMVNEK